jgi:hypothetical protein
MARFIEPILTHHDRSRFEVFCYSNVSQPDAATVRLQGLSEHWQDIRGISDEKASFMIEADGIDILVDLAGHTSGNRLPLFALRPAPVQATWIAYPDTTGCWNRSGPEQGALPLPPGKGRGEGRCRRQSSFLRWRGGGPKKVTDEVNRVGGRDYFPPSSHTTLRKVPYRAVPVSMLLAISIPAVL